MTQVYHSSDIPTTKVCTKCHTEKVLDDFAFFHKRKDRWQSWCKKCANAWRSQHTKDTYDVTAKRDTHLRNTYGITLAEYNIMLEEQGGVCACCKQPAKEHFIGRARSQKLSLVVDHCHVTGAVRSLLCHDCNAALGHLREDAERARQMATYIEERCLW